MTPDQRARNSAQKWLKTSIREMARIADSLEADLKIAGYDEGGSLERAIADLRKQAKRCAHHGLGTAIQPGLL